MGVPLSAADEIGTPPPRAPLTPEQRRQRRAAITLLSLAFLLILALLFAGAYYLGWFGKTSAADSLPPCQTLPAAIQPSEVKLNVYNSTNRQGLARAVATTMRSRGFLVGKVANDPLHAKIKNAADIRYGPKGKAAAELVSRELTGATLVEVKRKDASVDLVLGTGYKALGPIPPTSTNPTGQACKPAPTGSATSTSTAHPSATATTKATAKSTKSTGD